MTNFTMRVDVPEDIQKKAQKLAKLITQKLEGGIGFMLFIAPFSNEPGDDWVMYVSNSQRPEMMEVLRSFLATHDLETATVPTETSH
jgi:hypothetical protein